MRSQWRDRIAGMTSDVTFAAAGAAGKIRAAAIALGGSLPTPLVDLLCESDGVEGQYGLGLGMRITLR